MSELFFFAIQPCWFIVFISSWVNEDGFKQLHWVPRKMSLELTTRVILTYRNYYLLIAVCSTRIKQGINQFWLVNTGGKISKSWSRVYTSSVWKKYTNEIQSCIWTACRYCVQIWFKHWSSMLFSCQTSYVRFLHSLQTVVVHSALYEVVLRLSFLDRIRIWKYLVKPEFPVKKNLAGDGREPTLKQVLTFQTNSGCY